MVVAGRKRRDGGKERERKGNVSPESMAVLGRGEWNESLESTAVAGRRERKEGKGGKGRERRQCSRVLEGVAEGGKEGRWVSVTSQHDPRQKQTRDAQTHLGAANSFFLFPHPIPSVFSLGGTEKSPCVTPGNKSLPLFLASAFIHRGGNGFNVSIHRGKTVSLQRGGNQT